jgi:hypothetical protein
MRGGNGRFYSRNKSDRGGIGPVRRNRPRTIAKESNSQNVSNGAIAYSQLHGDLFSFPVSQFLARNLDNSLALNALLGVYLHVSSLTPSRF